MAPKSTQSRAGVEPAWTHQERALFRTLDSPERIQAYLDETPYSTEPIYRSPRTVICDRKAHCFDGALFAAAALRQLGHPPVVLDMLPHNDDDHMLALFRRHGRIGAVAKSNFTGLRYREPVYRNLRELVLSYFESFFNVDREKTLRGYWAPLNLARLDRFDWMTSDANLEEVEKALGRQRVITLISPAMAASFAPVDARSYDAGLMGSDEAGLYRPGGKDR
jgi:hypothetical protein